MTLHPRTIIAAVIVTAAFASNASAQSRSYDFRSGGFPRFSTFSFKDPPASATQTENVTTYDSPLIDERIRTAVAAQLESRGLKRDDANPDVYVVARRTYKTEYVYYGSYGWGPGVYWGSYGWGPYYGYGLASWDGYGPVYQDERIIGRMTIDLEDASNGRLIWRGVGEKHVHETSRPSSRDRRINEQVEKLFKDFPPTER